MENPDSWTPEVRIIYEAICQHEADLVRGAIGNSLPMFIWTKLEAAMRPTAESGARELVDAVHVAARQGMSVTFSVRQIEQLSREIKELESRPAAESGDGFNEGREAAANVAADFCYDHKRESDMYAAKGCERDADIHHGRAVTASDIARAIRALKRPAATRPAPEEDKHGTS